MPSIIRQSAIMYMGSMLCRASYINIRWVSCCFAVKWH
jgi:hypothetical protein